MVQRLIEHGFHSGVSDRRKEHMKLKIAETGNQGFPERTWKMGVGRLDVGR
jgi:hypothetical protein